MICSNWHRALSLMVLLFSLASPARSAEFTGHWTLDDLSGGILNQGTDGSTSDMTVMGGPTVVPGFIGGAISFNGSTDYLINQVAGNAAADLTGYPISFSTWVKREVSDTSAGAHNVAIGFTDVSTTDVAFGAGFHTSDSGEVVTRNGGSGSFDLAGSGVTDGLWHHIAGVVNSTTSVEIFIDGKLVGGDTQAESFNTDVDTLTIGAMLRNTGLITQLGGDVDDAGLYDSNLSAGEVAVIHGLGRIGEISLDQFDEAQLLLNSSVGSTGLIDGVLWRRVDDLVGTTGDYGGDLNSYSAFIVTDDLGGGLAQVGLVPEPSSFLLLGLGMLGLLKRRRR